MSDHRGEYTIQRWVSEKEHKKRMQVLYTDDPQGPITFNLFIICLICTFTFVKIMSYIVGKYVA